MLVERREHRVSLRTPRKRERPVDCEVGVIGTNSGVQLLPVRLRVEIQDRRVRFQHLIAVRNPRRDQQGTVLVATQLLREPTTDGRGVRSEIDGDVPDCAGDAGNDLVLGRRRQQHVQAPDRARSDVVGEVRLAERKRTPSKDSSPKLGLTEQPSEVPPLVIERCSFDDEHPLDAAPAKLETRTAAFLQHSDTPSVLLSFEEDSLFPRVKYAPRQHLRGCKGLRVHIAVTGARGFIGRRVVKSLLRMGVEVTSVERPRCTKDPHVWPTYSSVNRRWVDLAGGSSHIHEDCGSPDVLIHLAWGGLPNYGSTRHLEHELPMHTAFLASALRSGTPHVVATGTCFEYGLAEGSLKETTPTRPTTLYAEAKVRLHEGVGSVADDVGGSLTWLRPFYVFGPDQPTTTLRGQLHAAIERGDAEFPMSAGYQTRDYLHVDDMAHLIAEISVREPSRNSVLNVSSGTPTRVRDLVDSWITEAGSSIRPVFGALPYSATEPMHAIGSTARLNQFFSTRDSLVSDAPNTRNVSTKAPRFG